jgi:two-component system, LytTR family, sensor kinase
VPPKRYSEKEPTVFLWVMIPYVFIMNLMIFGTCIFDSAFLFFKAFFISTIYFLVIYAIFGTVAVGIKNRFPSAGDLIKRVSILLPIFYLMNIFTIYGIYGFYPFTSWIKCEPISDMRWWTILYGCIMSTLITFINEGMANWEAWKSSLSEGEKLKNAYQRSKLLGLKGQINPHFLFNCFNTLSGLIQDDEKYAEEFLDEMTKVHRYMLRSDDQYLVPLKDEIRFARSYLFLTKARFGEAIKTEINISPELLEKWIPPLSMQVILENIIYNNVLNKKQPLNIEIRNNDQGDLVIVHSLNEKTIVQNIDAEEGLDNLINKYKLLNAEKIVILESHSERRIKIYLFESGVITA